MQEAQTPPPYRAHDVPSLQTIKESIRNKQEISSRLFDSPNSPEKHQALEEQLRAIKAEEDALNALHAELKEALSNRNSSPVKSAEELEIEVIREQIRELHAALEKEKEKTYALSLQISAGSEEAEKIRQELFKAEEYSKQVKDEAQKASEKQDREYEQSLMKKDLEIDRLKMVVKELEQEVQKLDQTVKDRDSELKSYKHSNAEKDVKIEQLKEAVKHTQESLMAFRDEVANLQLQNRNVCESSKEEMDALRSRLEVSEQNATLHQTNEDSLMKKLFSLKAEMEEQTAKLEEANDQIDELELKRDELQQQNIAMVKMDPLFLFVKLLQEKKCSSLDSQGSRLKQCERALGEFSAAWNELKFRECLKELECLKDLLSFYMHKVSPNV